MPEYNAHRCSVQYGELKGTPRFSLDGFSIWVEHFRTAAPDILVALLNAIRLDRQLRSIFRSKFGARYDVDFRAVSLDDSQVLIAIKYLETQTVNEEVQAFIQGGVKDLRNDSLDHRWISPHLESPRKTIGRSLAAIILLGDIRSL